MRRRRLWCRPRGGAGKIAMPFRPRSDFAGFIPGSMLTGATREGALGDLIWKSPENCGPGVPSITVGAGQGLSVALGVCSQGSRKCCCCMLDLLVCISPGWFSQRTLEMLDLMALGPGPMVPSRAEEGSCPSEGGRQLWKGQSGRRKHSSLMVTTGIV